LVLFTEDYNNNNNETLNSIATFLIRRLQTRGK